MVILMNIEKKFRMSEMDIIESNEISEVWCDKYLRKTWLVYVVHQSIEFKSK